MKAGVVEQARRRETARARRVAGALLVALIAMVALSLSYGDFQISLPDVVRSLLGRPAPAGVDYVMHELRLPRASVSVLAGLAFGLAGAIFQQLLRNPLASPDVIGVSQGATTAAVVTVLVFGVDGSFVAATALAGAVLTALLIYTLSWRKGVGGYRFILVGIGVGTVLTSITSYVLTRSDVKIAAEAMIWLTGSVNGRTWSQIVPLAVAVLILLPLALTLGRALTGMQLGDDLATAFGVRVQASRFALLLVAVVLAGTATSAAGPIAFVAFMSGPIAVRMVGGGRPVLLQAALVGALLVLVSDFIGAHLLGPRQFPVGVVTGVIGAPYLLWLLATANRSGRGG
ncbi:FecCD family ABC transporter permease [Paractinoplanes brasiliensis]|uniref:Iron complex transport system permease protein n=1 Tax=Paractinoplanes brasiliensis TaxID=52695 RepID=A0A4R6JR78_9ACTN|nr:iron chelate uptake ABC transporter family permease subunit [Actinoplanes brasiliensis]TDO38909.1 iron complex transport system permease protein [Actinoplanes brasiliensis]GID26313.1 ABC transporter permease [Actinoplanes brasiliensis]